MTAIRSRQIAGRTYIARARNKGGGVSWQSTIAALKVFLASTAGANNPHSQTAMPSPPTITTSTAGGAAPSTDPTLTKAYRATTTPAAFSYRGGGVLMFGTLYRQFPVVNIAPTGGNLGSGLAGVCWRTAFLADAAKVAVRVLGTNSAPYRFIVDGRYVSFIGTLTVTNSGANWIVLNFGSKALREIIVEGEEGAAFEGVFVETADTVTVAPTPAKRMLILGDSFTSGSGATREGDNFAAIGADYLGIADAWCSGNGGTGYVATLTGTRYKLADRIAADIDRALIAGPLDLIVFAVGINDLGMSGIQSEAEACFNIARSKSPGALIFVLGPWDTAAPSGPSGNYTLVKNAIVAAVASRGGVYFIDTQGVAYTKFDVTHPDDPGHAALGVFLNDSIRLAVG